MLYILPSSFHKELQRTAAVAAMDQINGEGSQTKGNIEKRIFDLFHGNKSKGLISQVELLLDGKKKYAPLWEKSVVQVTSLQATTNQRMVLNSQLYTGSEIYAVGEHITKTRLVSANVNNSNVIITKPKLITGRTLYLQAGEVVKNVKKAIAASKAFMNDDGSFPSGKGINDAYVYVLDELYKELKDVVTRKDELESSNESTTEQSSVRPNVRPNDWLFNGWFAFVLFGPYSNNQMIIFTNTDPPKNADNKSRAALRISEKEEKAFKITTLDSPTKTGRTTKDKIMLSHIEQRNESNKIKENQNELAAVMVVLQSKIAKMNIVAKMAEKLCPLMNNDNPHYSLWKEVFELKNETNELDKKILELSIKKVEKPNPIRLFNQPLLDNEISDMSSLSNPTPKTNKRMFINLYPTPTSLESNTKQAKLRSPLENNMELVDTNTVNLESNSAYSVEE